MDVYRHVSDSGREKSAMLGVPDGPRASVWTEDRVEQLKQWDEYSNGMVAQKFREMGITFSRNAIIGKRFRLGIKSALARTKYSAGTRLNPDGQRVITPRPRKSRAKPQAPTLPPWIGRADPVEPLKINILDLGATQCRSVVDGETDDNCLPLYCGHPIVPYGHECYCAAHAGLYYRPSRA